MAATRNDIKTMAKERYPGAVTIELKRYSDFQTIGVSTTESAHPDWLLTVAGAGDAIAYRGNTLDELQTLLIAGQGLNKIPT